MLRICVAALIVVGTAAGAAAQGSRASVDGWIKSVDRSARQIEQAVKYGNADTLQREGYALMRMVAEVRTWPEIEGPWTVARVKCSLAAQSLANFTDDLRRGGQRGAAAADGSVQDFNTYMAECRTWARKIK